MSEKTEAKSQRQGVANENQDLVAALGGPLGIAESALPAAVFVIVNTASGDSKLAAYLAAGLALLLTLARFARRQTPQFAISGLVGVALSAYLVSKTGEAKNYFVPGLLLNIGFATAFVVSILARWPLIGVFVNSISGGGTEWRNDPSKLRIYSLLSWLWVGMFAIRIAVKGPLYLADQTTALGTANVVLGIPFYAVILWVTWRLLPSANQPSNDPQTTSS